MRNPAHEDDFDGKGFESGDTNPRRAKNPPGLSALAFRIGRHPDFLERMLERLALQEIPDGPNQATRPLAKLATRATDDPAIALLDAWAMALEVLSFYQERIANEGYLRTATERLSVLELAREVGYEISQGVAAETHLAFMVEDTPGSSGKARIEKGTRIHSIPRQDEFPQVFETSEEFTARTEWNLLTPRRKIPQEINGETKQIFLRGIDTGLQPGDSVLLTEEYGPQVSKPGLLWSLLTVRSVEPDSREEHTRITWDGDLNVGEGAGPLRDPHLLAFRERAALFGFNAPEWGFLPEEFRNKLQPENVDTPLPEWPDFSLSGDIDLDAVYPGILAESWVVLQANEPTVPVTDDRTDSTGDQTDSTVPTVPVELIQAGKVSAVTRHDFSLTAQITRIKPPSETDLSRFPIRETTVLAQSELLELAEMPLSTPLSVSQITLDGEVEGLRPGHLLFFSGRPVGSEEPVSELATISSANTDQAGHTVVELSPDLQNDFDHSAVSIFGNVTHVSHGETATEVLGSGDSSLVNQRFELRRPPLTFVSAPTIRGVQSTLEIRVNDVLWREVPSLYSQGPESQSYMVRIDAEGRPTVIFGDGKSGARLPSGRDNVEATYRSGIGMDGMLNSGQLTLLQTRPLGIQKAISPLPTAGAAPPESIGRIRENAPLAVRTLRRIVSLGDFESFANAFVGIEKAQAAPLWIQENRTVFITIAGVDGAKVDSDSQLFSNLQSAIDGAKEPLQKVLLESYEPLHFGLEAEVLVDPRHNPAVVLGKIRGALISGFSFEARSFGQPVAASEVIAAIQKIPGVEMVDLNSFYLVPSPAPGGGATAQPLEAKLNASLATLKGDGTGSPAQLITLHPGHVNLTVRGQNEQS